MISPAQLLKHREEALRASSSSPRALAKHERVLQIECVRRKMANDKLGNDFAAMKRCFPGLTTALQPMTMLDPVVLKRLRKVIRAPLQE